MTKRVRSAAFATVLLIAASLDARRSTLDAQQLGSLDFPTSGGAQAQPAFMRGVLYLHSFEYDSAAKAFREAQRLDPGFAMAYWGEALTYTHPVWFQQDASAARATLSRLAPTRAARAAKAATPREKRWLETVEVLYGDGPKEQRDTLYALEMERLARDFPDDREARAFLAVSLLGTSHGGRHTPTYMRAAAIAEEIFRDNPQHPGAAHYLIHSYDDPVHAPLGLRAARAYSKIAPGAAHAQHMTSHIYVAAGMWDDVVTANIAAWETSNRRNGHYTQWLAYGYQQQFRYADARRYVEAIRGDAARDPSLYKLGYLAVMASSYIVDSEQWDGGVAAWARDSLPALRSAIARQAFVSDFNTFEFAMALAASARGDRSGVERAQRAIEARVSAARAGAAGPRIPGLGTGGIMAQQLTATLLRADGKRDEAISVLRAAAALEEALPFDYGPPEPVKPPREMLGEFLLDAKRPAEAKAEFERALARTPRRSRALLGLARAHVALGDVQKAAAAYAQFRASTARSDTGVAEVAEAEKYLASAERSGR